MRVVPAIVALVLASAALADNEKVSFRRDLAWKPGWTFRVDSHQSQSSVLRAAGTEKRTQTLTRFDANVEVVQVDAGEPSLLTLVFRRAIVAGDEGESDLDLGGVTARGLEGIRRFQPVGRGSFDARQSRFLHQYFDREQTDAPGERDLLLPTDPTAVGQSWSPELSSLAAFVGVDPKSLDTAASSATCRLVRVHEMHGTRFAEIRIAVSLTTRIVGGIEFEAGRFDLDGTVDYAIDGSVPYAEERFEMAFRGSGGRIGETSGIELEGAIEGRSSTTPVGAVPAETDDEGLSGLYAASELKYKLNVRTGGYDCRLLRYHYLFFPDGRVYEGLPKEGLSGFEFEAAMAEDPRNCGRFEVQGKELVLEFGGGREAERWPFERIGGGRALRVGRWRYDRAEIGELGLHLEGAYAHQGYIDTSNAALDRGGWVISQNSIVFREDGQFRSTEFLGSYGDEPGDHWRTLHNESEGAYSEGTYRLEDGTLTLTFPDGQAERHTAYGIIGSGTPERPGLLVIDGVGYLPPTR